MASTDWTQLGLGAVVALLLLREVFSFILKWKKGQDATDERKLEEMAGHVRHMYKQHTQTDVHGVTPLVSMRMTMVAIEKTQEKQTEILDRITRVLDEMRLKPPRERVRSGGG
ncbi:hypothetical protein LCGC14_0375550 [marine sediment metagenome]|uniref:Uncharacterized protein n=1 Tax=marine sediment metagenome TaxID=412755 RepID=A0A0F9WCS1_9ZZZZ